MEDGVTLIEFVVADVFHKYVPAPFAIRVADWAAQIVGELIVITGTGFTVMVLVTGELGPEAFVEINVTE